MEYNTRLHLNDPDAYAKVLLNEYKNNYRSNPSIERVYVSLNIKYNEPFVQLIEELKQLIQTDSQGATVNYVETNLIEVYNNSVYVFVFIENENINIFEPGVMIRTNIRIFGATVTVKNIVDQLKSKYKKEGPEISWSYQDGEGGIRSSYFNLDTGKTFYPEFYPFMRSPETLGRRFLDSDANILIFLGPPGTGKTSFIRNMLISLNAGAMTTYDQEIARMDRFYINYINSEYNFVILEDSDLLLQSRDKDDNRVMNKILNTSDGLVSTRDKKFIFTANITQESRIDEALLRPGRCFEVVHFRELSVKEAQRAALAAKIDSTINTDCTMAEIFNQQKQKRTRMGF